MISMQKTNRTSLIFLIGAGFFCVIAHRDHHIHFFLLELTEGKIDPPGLFPALDQPGREQNAQVP